MTIGDETYSPSDLYLDEKAVVTLPNDAQFSDADKYLQTEIPASHPEGAVAVLFIHTMTVRSVLPGSTVQRQPLHRYLQKMVQITKLQAVRILPMQQKQEPLPQQTKRKSL